MNAEIIAVGSELLLGQIANTNGQYLSAELAGIGINVYRHTVVGDNWNRLRDSLSEAGERAEVVILTGGLGPTEDDLTKEVISEFTGRKLIVHKKTHDNMKEFFDRIGKVMTASNVKQAHYTEGAEVFYNKAGLACGMAVEEKGTWFILLPGPPREMKSMFDHDVRPFLQQKQDSEKVVLSRVLRFFGIGESSLEEMFKDLISTQTNPTIAPLAAEGEVTLRLTASAGNYVEADEMLEKLDQMIQHKAGKYLYGRGSDSLASNTVKWLSDHSLTLAAAESLTGGWFSKMITDISGASSVFRGGITAYTKIAKVHALGINEEFLDQHGMVSKECAEKMAEQVRSIMNSNIGISFTGVAGPDPLEGKEAGTVWVGIASAEGTSSHLLNLAGVREQIRRVSMYHGCRLLMERKGDSE
ncbi:competence/damage-inducible protein A [Alteribacillus sp. HJP-4]|uniref:competence/damage-inducible protein A n=1 Tax=Alteribacillus sp. HJP-4 TaxID=2775394 RepID=UPI0035CCE8E0